MEYGKLLHEFLNLGEALLVNGGEINRVEDTLHHLGRAYGAREMNIFVITSDIVVTVLFQDGTELTQTRRISGGSSVNFHKLEQLNALSRSCCSAPLSIGELHDRIAAIVRNPAPKWHFYLGSALAAGSFAVFFGGCWQDAAVSAVMGLLICFSQQTLAPICSNTIIFNFLISFGTGILLCILPKYVPMIHPDKIMIGDIMLLIPGIAITNSVQDMLVGDTISGTLRLVESLLWAGALALGFVTAIQLLGV